MHPLPSFLFALGFLAQLIADALLPMPGPGRSQRNMRIAQTGLLYGAVLLFAGTRLWFSNAEQPSFMEFALLWMFWSVGTTLVELVGRSPLIDRIGKLLVLWAGVFVVSLMHPSWGLLDQGPILLLGQQVHMENFAIGAIALPAATIVVIALSRRQRPVAALWAGSAAFGLLLVALPGIG